MSEDAKPVTVVGMTLPPVRNSLHAPIVYFDAAPCVGAVTGVVQVTLSTNLANPADVAGGVVGERAVVAYLRCNAIAAKDLISALQQSISLVEAADAQPPAQSALN